ncbi:hypothetical protein E1A91_A04G098900v1 [Gossypium mustelinum]|uniref:HAT C-terminal dimerisation domain-containing protein n=1 Tax=Gossypium mustelinum TaxID=34275 RepID=A0A5D2ZQE9_GOSMU|nr:hypothetical protein E1A91_A04G098900v1 [Gossypium mustelinum]TYJ39867.1 hypothetical protein E1A91_A04G098900v1 [Gossypium mustelinum]TYJ39868.1 hypothetical protein E1A91_A04G098900v1 [Gossypium mustelinum]
MNLFLCLSQWDTDNKIFSITLDNAFYNDDMVSCLKNCFRANQALLIRRKIFYDVVDKRFHLNVTKKFCQDFVLDYWGQRDKYYQIFILFDEEWRNIAILCNFLKDFVQTILSNLKLLFDKYVKNSKSTSSSLVESSNVSNNNLVYSSFHQLNYKSSIRYHEFSLLARDLLAILILIIASVSAFSTGKKVITPLRSSLKLKMVQAIVCFDDWMRAKGFSTCNYYSCFLVIIL